MVSILDGPDGLGLGSVDLGEDHAVPIPRARPAAPGAAADLLAFAEAPSSWVLLLLVLPFLRPGWPVLVTANGADDVGLSPARPAR